MRAVGSGSFTSVAHCTQFDESYTAMCNSVAVSKFICRGWGKTQSVRMCQSEFGNFPGYLVGLSRPGNLSILGWLSMSGLGRSSLAERVRRGWVYGRHLQYKQVHYRDSGMTVHKQWCPHWMAGTFLTCGRVLDSI